MAAGANGLCPAVCVRCNMEQIVPDGIELIEIKTARPIRLMNEAGRVRDFPMSSRLTAGDLQIITRVAVFRGLKPETVEHIIASATAVVLRPHEVIMRQDDPATAFFIVIDGCVKLYRSNRSGDETVVEIMTKGDSFAESIVFTGNRYMATAEAVSNVRVGRIPADHLVRCIRADPPPQKWSDLRYV